MNPPTSGSKCAPARFRLTALLLVFSLLTLALPIPQRFASIIPIAQAASPNLVISQIYGGGGNSGATYKNDFIELYNRGATPVNITGWSVQYASATGTTWQVTSLSGTVIPGGYYLIQQAAGTGGTAELPTPNATGGIPMSATAGKVALVNSTTALSGACPTGSQIIDFVGFGGANCSEGAPTPALTNTTAALRKLNGAQDFDNNSNDFSVGAPAPRSTLPPGGTGLSNPSSVAVGEQTLLTVAVTSGTTPASSGLGVRADLSSIGGSTTQQFYDDGTNGDAVAGNNIFSFLAIVGGGTTGGGKNLSATITDAQGRTGSTVISVSILAPTSPSGAGSANPISVLPGASSTLTVNVTPGTSPASTGLAVTANLSSIGGSAAQAFTGSGNTFTFSATVAHDVVAGEKSLPVTITDAQGRSGSTSISLTVQQPPTPVPGGAVVISQVYGGGGNVNGIYKNDYIEIFNRSSQTVTLNNWSVQFAQAMDTGWTVSPFTATLAPGQYFLIRQSAGTSCNGGPCGTDLPFFDATGALTVGSTSGKVALVNNATALVGSCPTGSSIVDFLGYGSVNCSEGDDSAPGDNAGSGLSNTTAAYRAGDGCIDTNSNAADFTAAAPAPRYSGSATKNCEDVAPPTGQVDSTVVISQVYGGGGNTNAAYTHDFVELYNRGTGPVSLNGWSLQYASASGSGWETNKQPLGGIIAPGEYFLVSLGSGGANGSALPPANVVGEINLSATAGKVALVRSFDGLSGNCPLSDPNLADMVGYGSTADCGEGNKKAPTPGATTSLFRKNDGASDTNNNQTDFQTGAPQPRRTAPIVELGPFVFSTDPRSGSTTAPRDASITINFTEPVQVTGQWFDIQCATTGAHNSATISGGPKTYTITPNVSFVNNEQCTVRVFKTAVNDLDTDDAGTDTDHLPADHVWTFRTSTGAPPVHPPSVHLALGNPTGATTDLSVPNNYLMEKPEFALSYNRDKGTANWVSWHLSSEWIGGLSRVDSFRPDPAVPADWYRVLSTDYSGSGFDRGHMVPNADRDNENSLPINQATFLMTNIIPQSPDNNQGPWAAQENYFRTLLPANELYIVAGGIGQGGFGSGGFANTIVGGKVHVPSHTWKVALVLPKGEADLSRVTCGTRTIAVLMPNVQGIRNDNWEKYLTTVDQIESLTGYDFFANLPDGVEHCVEAGTNGSNTTPGAADLSVMTDEDTTASLTLNGLSAGNNSLTYTIVTQPAHGTLAGTDAGRTYTPAPNFHGTDSFTYRVSDGSRHSNTATVSINVFPVNDAPVATDDSATTDEDTPVTINVLGNDTDVENDALAVTAVGVASNGSAAIENGQVIFTPAADYHGPASFTYTVSDGNGGTATGSVSVTVNPVNDAPVLSNVPASATIDELSPYTFTATASDVDVPAQSLVFSLADAPTGATIDPATGQFIWTPTEAQGGAGSPFTFRVRLSDGLVQIEQAVTLAVNEVNQAPTLAPIGNKVVALGNTLSFVAVGADGDVPAQTLTYSLTGAVPAGAAINSSNGAFSWTPSAAQAGSVYIFSVRVTDNGSGALYAQEQIRVGVAYNWSGLLQPINIDGNSVFKLGSTIPVKFSLTGASAGITNAVVRLTLAKVSGEVIGSEMEAESTTAATIGNLFRYDATSRQYIFNLSTKELTAGTYQLRVDMGDDALRTVNISLRN
jgi:DNA/RNA endonuclease G (NUC1)